MITVNVASALIGGTFDRAKPDVALDGGPTGDLVIAHLTEGLNKVDPQKSAAALRIDGQVGITADAQGPPASDFKVALQLAPPARKVNFTRPNVNWSETQKRSSFPHEYRAGARKPPQRPWRQA